MAMARGLAHQLRYSQQVSVVNKISAMSDLDGMYNSPEGYTAAFDLADGDPYRNFVVP